MFKTIKSKILLITLLMLITLSSLFCIFTFLYLKSSKNLILESYFHSIAVFADNINKEILKIEDNAKDLALQGEMFYKIDKNKKMAENTTIRLFENYENSLGGGIWFKPYSVNKNKRLYCVYAYRNKSNKVVSDDAFETNEYNYPTQSWYTDIMPELAKGKKIAWSLPYHESVGSNTLMVTAGSGIFNKNRLVGLSTVDWEIESIVNDVSKIKPTQNSFALFADKTRDHIIATNDPYLDSASLVGKSLKELPWYRDNLKQKTYFKYHNKKYIPYVKTLDNGMILIVNIPKHELFAVLYKHVLLLFFGLMVTSLLIAYLLYFGLKKYINKPIDTLTELANTIREGNLNTKIKIEKPEEFARLADTFNKMTQDIKNITKDRERIESELSLAKAIQESSLPNIFPPFPDNKEFDIFAGMEAAKEVGGDFYDFYFIDDTHLMFLIADVSGKGVPAALFMMTTKTLINYIALSGCAPDEMMAKINQKIYDNNKHGFFVTMLAGILDTKTGELNFVNCGHNPPLIKKSDGTTEYLKLNPNIVLGVFNEAKFEINTTKLSKDDTMILYTDGVTEAMNSADELFGEERLLNAVKTTTTNDIQKLRAGIKEKIKEFTENMPQSDDMTMLLLKFNGQETNKESYRNNASISTYPEYLNWLQNICKKLNITPDLQYKLDLISEEMYANISNYAYPNKDGFINITIEKTKNGVTIEFTDEGQPFDPLAKPDPNTTDFPDDRKPGGFGIFIVKNYSKSINYEYKDNKNILTVQV